MFNGTLRFALGAVALGCLTAFSGGSAALAQAPQLGAGTKAPAFTSTTLNGKQISLASLRGHVVLVDFWATWCEPCKMAMPTLESLYKKYGKDGFHVVGMSVDDSQSSGDIPSVVKQLGVTYTITSTKDANQKVGNAYNVSGIPAQFLIDKKGVIRWSQAGYSEDEGTTLSAMIHKLQKE